MSTRLRSSERTRYHKVCENLINALKLLANQQEDGDGPMQSNVTNLCEGSRTRTHGLLEKLFKSGQPSCPGSVSPEGMLKVLSRHGGQNVNKEAQRCLSGKALKN